jgi:hypothetical protein
MNTDEAIGIADAFIQTQPKSWQQIWPAKRKMAKKTKSRVSDNEVWVVRSLRSGFEMANIWIEIDERTNSVSYAICGGWRAPHEEYVRA